MNKNYLSCASWGSEHAQISTMLGENLNALTNVNIALCARLHQCVPSKTYFYFRTFYNRTFYSGSFRGTSYFPGFYNSLASSGTVGQTVIKKRSTTARITHNLSLSLVNSPNCASWSLLNDLFYFYSYSSVKFLPH